MTFADAVRNCLANNPRKDYFFAERLGELQDRLQPLVDTLLKMNPVFAEEWMRQSFAGAGTDHAVVVWMYKEQRATDTIGSN